MKDLPSLIFIDTEFNGFGGELISMALVDMDGNEFYEVLAKQTEEDTTPWVAEHVLPKLGKNAVTMGYFQQELQRFLMPYKTFRLVADWPEDHKHFCNMLILKPGVMMAVDSFEMEVWRNNTRWPDWSHSAIPHNALEDAKALLKNYGVHKGFW